ncbi:uncharacterized protein LOC128224514 isoform X1 [Mya arenaria]|uniref:uncharacterized protein LOC128224514 isoform X1 n=1 Tax=Mya arenaria TaxID=6604 RepID=UPI0022E81CCF|nr:uncharacterized protein LOC128224514 isoform X1 [Mya arenaria]
MPGNTRHKWRGIKMPCRMKGAAVQCCMCVVGVFMFLGGIIMTATGITLILNYGLLDIELLPPDLDNEEGKRTVGIILTTCGLLAVLVSVIVSILYLCNKTKPSVNPDDMSRIPSSARNNTPDRPDYQRRHDRGNDRFDRRSISSISAKVGNGHSSAATSRNPSKEIYSAEVQHRTPRTRAHRAKKHQARHKHRLDQIKEDAISRKTVDGAIEENEYMETTRSGSFSSEMTLEDRHRLPRIIHDHVDNREVERPPSADSASTSQTSDISGYRYSGEADKSRRELQFLPDSMYKDYQRQLETNSKDSASPDMYDETSLTESRNFDQCSLTSDNLRKLSQQNDSPLLPDFHSKTNHSAGGITSYDGGAELDSPEAPSADDSVVSYKASYHTERHGEQTTGRISPQIGEPEHYTNVEAVSNSGTSLKS